MSQIFVPEAGKLRISLYPAIPQSPVECCARHLSAPRQAKQDGDGFCSPIQRWVFFHSLSIPWWIFSAKPRIFSTLVTEKFISAESASDFNILWSLKQLIVSRIVCRSGIGNLDEATTWQ